MKHLKLFEELINEIGDASAKPYKWRRMDRRYDTYYIFTTDSGLEYQVMTELGSGDTLTVEYGVEVITKQGNKSIDYELVTNRYPLTYPDGLDVDVMDIKSLENANKNATDKKHKEHIVPYFWESGRKFLNFEDVENGFKKYRWTIDYKEDFLVIDEIIKNLYPKYGNNYVTKDVLDFLDSNHEISKINSHYIK